MTEINVSISRYYIKKAIYSYKIISYKQLNACVLITFFNAFSRKIFNIALAADIEELVRS